MPPEVQVITDILGWIRSGGDIAVIVLILYAGYRGWWVWGWQFDRVLKELERALRDKDQWQSAALTGTYLTERLTQHIAPPSPPTETAPETRR